MLKGVLHVHSTYSDGERSLVQLRELFLGEGCRFVVMSDHADSLDAARVRDYVAECRELSDGQFVFVPGLEFSCDRRMHMLGYGVTSLCASTDPQEVIAHIKRERGVSVVAHPQDSAFDWIESFEILPAGIEVWNTKYDGQYAPRGRTFRLLQRLQQRQPDMLAFYGLDNHWMKQFRELYTVVRIDGLDPQDILAALRGGNFHASKGELELPSNGRIDDATMTRFERTNARSTGARRFLQRINGLRKRLGLRLPAPIKAQVRRFF
jgi:hypothetical protein